MCFVTDRFPRLTYVPRVYPFEKYTVAVAAELWGPDAMPFHGGNLAQRRRRVTDAFLSPDGQPWPSTAVCDALATSSTAADWNWTTTPGVGGAVKLDRPGDDYFAASLYYQSRLATEDFSELRPWGRTFLAGDSVGHLGGWAEGAAMSALAATTAALWQVRKFNGDQDAFVRSAALIDPLTPKFHQWTTIGTFAKALPTWKAMTAVAPCGLPPRPPRWRWEPKDAMLTEDRVQIAVAQSGRWMVSRSLGQLGWRTYDQYARRWNPEWVWVRNLGIVTNARISAGQPNPSEHPGRAHIVAFTADPPGLRYGSSADLNTWTEVPVGTKTSDEVGIAVAGLGQPWPESAHVVTLRASDSVLLPLHSHRRRQLDPVRPPTGALWRQGDGRVQGRYRGGAELRSRCRHRHRPQGQSAGDRP